MHRSPTGTPLAFRFVPAGGVESPTMTDTAPQPRTWSRGRVVHPAPTVANHPAGPGRYRTPLIMFAAVAVIVWVAIWIGNTQFAHDAFFPARPGIAGGTWFEGWQRWDAYWYRTIVREGYVSYPGVQSSVAFWPSYPLLVRAVSWAFPSIFITGSIVTLCCGAVSAVLLRRWVGVFLPRAAAVTTVALFLVYPYGYYQYGAVYADALFVAVTIGAFLLVERDRLFWAGVVGIVATAARPAGVVVAVALVLRVIELRNLARAERSQQQLSLWKRLDPRVLQWRDSPVFLAFCGVGAWSAFLGFRFGDPLLFATVESTWGQGAGPSTWLKFRIFEELRDRPLEAGTIGHVVQGLLLIGALALVPRIVRRFGWAYALFTLGVIGLALVGTKDFQSSGRYLIGAFPCFAVLGELLAARPPLRFVVLVLSLVALAVMAVAYGRGTYLA
ncbi:unannotated protein [freshwater metagenome]|uniref:Unannotated protein n=1 Tax=freshwater metagenome TaxID=449393 RepID=A0A6J5YDI9_9ZZZZ